MERLKFIIKYISIFIILIYSITSQAHAIPNPIAYPPHHVKPGLPTLSPSGLMPAQLNLAYGFNFSSFQGAGQTIGIVDAYDNPTVESDLGVFNTAFSLPDCTTANGCFT